MPNSQEREPEQSGREQKQEPIRYWGPGGQWSSVPAKPGETLSWEQYLIRLGEQIRLTQESFPTFDMRAEIERRWGYDPGELKRPEDIVWTHQLQEIMLQWGNVSQRDFPVTLESDPTEWEMEGPLTDPLIWLDDLIPEADSGWKPEGWL